MWRLYYIVNEIRIYIMEFKYLIDANNWMATYCSEKPDGYYYGDLKIFGEYY